MLERTGIFLIDCVLFLNYDPGGKMFLLYRYRRGDLIFLFKVYMVILN